MPIALRQQAGHTEDAGQNRSLSVTLSQSTLSNSLLVIVCSVSHPYENVSALPSVPSGFSLVFNRRSGKQTTAMWQRTAAPVTSKITVNSSGETYGIQARVLEFTGAAQTNAVDRVTVNSSESSTVSSGSTGTTSQADELLIGVVCNRYASTTQFGFTGGLGQYSQTLSDGSEPDHDRTRLTVLGGITSTTGSFAIGAKLSTSRDWVGALVSFRGGSLGPARMTSKAQTPAIRITGTARLSAFGPMRSKNQPVAIGIGGRVWIGPFENQFLLGGRDGLLIGANTDYRVESVEGLGGTDIRSSDTAFPRSDGDQRGLDYQTARQIMFRVNFNGPGLEARMQALLSTLRPRRETDWDLFFRLPGMPLQVIHCRPMGLSRELSLERMIVANQAFALRAADPRIYSSGWREITVPVSDASEIVTAVSAPNLGNANAYPIISVTAPSTTQVTAFELVNITGNIAFSFDGILPPGGQLIADMPAVVTSEPRSKILIDGQPKYGSWVAPREPFYLAPNPDAPNGINALYLRTTPTQTDVTCTLRYRDTWYG